MSFVVNIPVFHLDERPDRFGVTRNFKAVELSHLFLAFLREFFRGTIDSIPQTAFSEPRAHAMSNDLKSFIADIPDFPKPGIMFRDISPLLRAPTAFRHVVNLMAKEVSDLKVAGIVAVESRGFLFAAPVAHEAGVPLVLARKPGKLPGDRVRVEYGLEYGTDSLELKHGLIDPGSRMVIIDDVLATGGTARAAGDLVQKVSASVASYIFLVELLGLGGREKLKDGAVSSLVQY